MSKYEQTLIKDLQSQVNELTITNGELEAQVSARDEMIKELIAQMEAMEAINTEKNKAEIEKMKEKNTNITNELKDEKLTKLQLERVINDLRGKLQQEKQLSQARQHQTGNFDKTSMQSQIRGLETKLKARMDDIKVLERENQVLERENQDILIELRATNSYYAYMEDCVAEYDRYLASINSTN